MNTLTITIWSFSYRAGAPILHGPDGGGYVFDCRLLPNPGRETLYAARTGRDADVVAYLEARSEVGEFVAAVGALVSRSVTTYLERGFSNLFIGFGCTGGQHRSVYCSERIAAELSTAFAGKVVVNLRHVELEKKGLLR